MTKAKRDAYQVVTDQILAALDKGIVPWVQPWQGGFDMPRSISTGKAYRGVNVMLLGFQPYASPWWGTYNRIKKSGGQVRKGEHGTRVVFWKVWEKDAKEEGQEPEKVFMLRSFTVFNVDQADWPEGMPEKWQPVKPEDMEEIDSLQALDSMVADYQDAPTITRAGTRAFYRPTTDQVQVPEAKLFTEAHGEFNTMAHELVHSTGHKSRLGRLEMSWFGSEPYATEELVAEVGAAMLAAHYGVSDDSQLKQSASYIDGWRKAISQDKKLVVKAAGSAMKAVARITGQTEEVEA